MSAFTMPEAAAVGELGLSVQEEAALAAVRAELAAETRQSKYQGPLLTRQLDLVFADNLPSIYTPASELVERLLTLEGGSLVYGASNSGKTFFAIDLACAVARGTRWMGRQTEPGLVVYLAAESPSSVQSRLQAYQQHHGARVPNFAIVQSPIDLFSSDDDTHAIISNVRGIEDETGQKVRLIVGDTLARMSAGANENAGQDMGQVVRRLDLIRAVCQAHFMLIHHSGKLHAAGARGWSGVRAAVDTEIELTDSAAGHCAGITKQRDLNSKGERIGFRLQPITLGVTKWGTPATSCIVMPADAPKREPGKRTSEVGGAILELLGSRPEGVKKIDIVKHYVGKYDKSAVYREMKKLVEARKVRDCDGMFFFAKEGGADGAN